MGGGVIVVDVIVVAVPLSISASGESISYPFCLYIDVQSRLACHENTMDY